MISSVTIKWQQSRQISLSATSPTIAIHILILGTENIPFHLALKTDWLSGWMTLRLPNSRLPAFSLIFAMLILCIHVGSPTFVGFRLYFYFSYALTSPSLHTSVFQ